MDMLSDGQAAALAGLFGGVLLGLAARMGRFCTLGAIEDFLYGEDDLRLRMWGLALALSVVGAFGLVAAGLLVPAETLYLSQAWNPLASVTGGLMFGYGMALAGNCGYGALARAGGGDLRAWVLVLVMGVAAYMALSGPTAVMRDWLFPPVPVEGALPGLAHLLGGITGVAPHVVGLAVGGVAVLASLSSARLRRHPAAIFWAAVVAVAITSGWAATEHIATTGFDLVPVESHTFSAPIGESLIYVMTSTGSTVDFGVGSVVGVLLGAMAGSLLKGQFRWEACEDPRELRRQLLGAFLMGTGAVLALGCSVGQGLSAFSLLAYSAPVVLGSIFVGAMLGLRILIVGLVDHAPGN